jgi:hypothetical protein
MKNLDEIKKNVSSSIKSLLYLIDVSTRYDFKIIDAHFNHLNDSRTPHDIDGIEYFLTVKFYKDYTEPYPSVEIYNVDKKISEIIDDVYLDKNGKIRQQKEVGDISDNIYLITNIDYDYEKNKSIELTYDMLFIIYFYDA